MVKSGAAPSEENVAAEGEAQILVSEFPPPPYYYQHAERLTPPPIPQDALTRGTQRAARMAAKGRAESERMRLGDTEADKTDAILGGVSETQDEEDSGDVVAVFGEIVEDPWQIQPIDPCEDPTKIRDEVKRLNSQVIQGFVKLLQDLVHRPGENKKTRDELSHNVFLMLQECNKFREHQARETLIELLEKQLSERQRFIKELRKCIERADDLLPKKSDD